MGTLQASHMITKSAGFSPIYYIHVIINTIKQSKDKHVNKNSLVKPRTSSPKINLSRRYWPLSDITKNMIPGLILIQKKVTKPIMCHY